MAEKWSSLIAEFVNVTGLGRDRAKSLLDVTNGNLEMAIEMHFDSCTSEEQAGPSNQHEATATPSSSSASNQENTEDEVRAPIPQTRGILVDEPYSNFGTKKRTSRSVFDAFRDFQAEAKQQELEAKGEGSASKRRTLQDLFRPPIDLLHKGTFETAKTSGQQQTKWLLVNVQDVKEFTCQQLNRDVWSNELVRNMIKENFVLWQVYRDTDEGERFIQFYHVSSYPYLAILDPRTGEKLINWGFMDAQAFCDNATEFLLNQSGLREESPPPKRSKKESIVDASEDSQLEAAIAASLRYSTSTANDNASDDDNKDGDNDDLQFTDSDTEEETWKPQKISKGKLSFKNKTVNFIDNKDNAPSTSTAIVESSMNKDNNTHSKQDSSEIRNNLQSSSALNNLDPTKDTKNPISGVSSTTLSSPSSTVSSSAIDISCYKRWQNEAGPMCKLMLRFPNGGRKQVSLNAEAPLLALVQCVQSEGFPNERYEMLTNFPKKKLSYFDFTVTLREAGLFPHETVFVQER